MDIYGVPETTPSGQVADLVDVHLRASLSELLKAWRFALLARRDAWDFALERRRLLDLGVCDTELRWLVCMGYAEHCREETRPEDESRRFRPGKNTVFQKRTCFVLTDKGVSFAAGVLGIRQESCATNNARASENDDAPSSSSSMPATANAVVWDAERHELRCGGRLVKQYKWLAANQEMILAAFQEENWPPRIDDPLPPQAEKDSKRRLHDAIKCLNRNQIHKLIHFRGDGTGEGVIWEPIDEHGEEG